MANIKGVLKINDNGNGVLESFISNIPTNNLSISPQTTDILSAVENFNSTNKEFGGAGGTPIGLTTISNMRFGVIDTNNVRSEQYNGLDFGYTNSNGVLNLTLTIVGTDIINFKIYFDKSRNQYPTDYTWYDIDNTAHVVTGNTSDEISFSQRAGYGTTTIVFSQWALPNVNVAITYIENIEIDIFMDKQWIINYQSQSQKTNDASKLIFGPLANTGQILLKDINNKLYDNAKLGYLNMNLFVLELYINNKLIQYHIADDSPYYSSNATLQLQLSNELGKWKDIKVDAHTFPSSTPVYNILSYILDFYETNYINNVVFEDCYIVSIADATQQTTLLKISITTLLQVFRTSSSFTLQSDFLINEIEKICTTMFLNCYMDDNNVVHFVSSRPLLNYVKDEDYALNEVIDIPYRCQVTKLEYDMLVYNRYDDVEID